MIDLDLRKEYPEFFEHCDIDLPPGWNRLVRTLMHQLVNDITYNGEKPFQFTQVKEKFGTLRMYYQGASLRQDALITMTERVSAMFCQTTGETGEVRSIGGWYVCLSESEYTKALAEQKSA